VSKLPPGGTVISWFRYQGKAHAIITEAGPASGNIACGRAVSGSGWFHGTVAAVEKLGLEMCPECRQQFSRCVISAPGATGGQP
jgi:hypothetical protein